MGAFVYALNDAVESVRSAAAGAIGNQVKRNSCCCSPCVINALTYALGDCDKRVRREAEKALGYCGYSVVAPCDSACTDGACSSAYSPATNAAPEAAPTPPPPAEPKAYLQKSDIGAHTVSSRKSLKNVFGLLH
jgi:hypothetical protein